MCGQNLGMCFRVGAHSCLGPPTRRSNRPGRVEASRDPARICVEADSGRHADRLAVPSLSVRVDARVASYRGCPRPTGRHHRLGLRACRATAVSPRWAAAFDIAASRSQAPSRGASRLQRGNAARSKRGARDGLASSLQLGPEQALVEAGTDEIIVPLGPFELVGSVSEWEDVIARERAEYQPSANAPEDRPTERFEGERRGFPIKESDEGHIAVRRLGDERADSRPPAEHHRPSPRAPMRGLTAPAACSPRWATRQSGVVRRRRRADYVRPTSAIGVVGRRSRSPLAMRVVGHAIFDVLTPEPGERRQSHGAERRSRGRGLAAVNATPIESSCRSRK